MRHRVAFRKLGRVTEHRIAMLRSQAQALLLHEHIETTVPKAKELRPFVERLITVAKRGIADTSTPTRALTARRVVLKDIVDRDVVGKLFNEIAPRFATRPGGYTRLLRVGYRLGDAAEVARVELVGSEYDPKKAKADKEAKEGEKPQQKGVGGRLRAAADRLRGKRAAEEAEGEAAAVETKSQARAAARKGSGGARRAPGGKGTK
jgi:large subunit ribosomal protein L17